METELLSYSSEYIEGSGGKGGGGGGHTPFEANDTLSSKQTVRLLLAISEGEIQGIDDITLNGVSVSSYPSVSWEFRSGTADQTVIKGFSTVESPLAGSFPTTLAVSPTVEYVGTLPGDATAARITMGLSRLLQVNADGDRIGYSVSCSFYTRIHTPSGYTSWVFIKTSIKTGKSTNPYDWDIRVERPAAVNPTTDTWEIKVVRVTPDDINDSVYSVIAVAAVTQIYDSLLTYPYTALLGLTIGDASQFNGRVPDIRIKPKGIKMLMPSNYTVATRTYDESIPWNFAFKSVAEYTDNLSWATYYSLTHTRWGVPLKVSDIDVGSFYSYAKHCDALVPDGLGGTEPRFRIDVQFIERTNTPTFLMYLLSLGNAQLGPNAYGQIAVYYDHANQAITKQETNATVLDGEFRCSSNGMDERVNSVTATFSSRLRNGDTDIAFEKDDTLITQMGIVPADLVLTGCTRESQAKRKCRWAIWANSHDTSIVSFRKLFGGAVYRKGELVSIMDSESVDTVSHHAIVRLSEFTAGVTAITLDRPITLSATAYTVSFILSTGVIQNNVAIAQTNGTFSYVTVVGNVSLFLDSTIIFSSATIQPRIVKVIKVTKNDNEYNIVCSAHTETKYSYIDDITSVVVPDSSGSFVNISNLVAPAPVNLTFTEVFTGGVITTSYINVAWEWDITGTQDYRPTYRLMYRRDGTQSVTVEGLSTTNYDIPDTIPGTYEVYVWAVNPKSGLPSAALFDTYAYRITPATSSLIAPTNLYVENTVGGTFYTKDLVLTWTNPATNTSVTTPDRLKDYVVEIRNYNSPFALKKTYIVAPDANDNGRFVFPFAENVSVFTTATRQFRVRVYCRDLVGDISTATELVCSNTVPSHVSFTANLTFGTGVVYANISNSSEKDVVGYIIQQDDNAGFTTPVTVYDGPDTLPSIPVDPSAGLNYYRIAAYDDFDKVGLDYASIGSGTTSAAAGASDQYAFSGLTFTPNSPTANKVEWTAGTVSKNNASPTTINTGSTPTAWTSGTIYIYYPGTGGTALVATTDITLAVAGSIIVATYRGGNDINVGNGKAFIDGSNLIAHTVGANQVVTAGLITVAAQIDNALINNAHISGSAAIENAKIANDLQSSTYNATRKEGWKIDKTGSIETYGKIKIGTPNAGVGIATSTFVPGAFTLNGNALLNNSIIKKSTSTVVYDTQGYSSQSYLSSCSCFFSFAQVTGSVAAGLSVTPTIAATMISINYAIVGEPAGVLKIYESGTLKGSYGTYTVDDLFEIRYSGTTINYLKNGTSFATSTVPASLTLFFDSAILTQNAVIDQIKFGQYASVTPDYGARMEITGDVIRVYDRNNVLRVKLGNLSA